MKSKESNLQRGRKCWNPGHVEGHVSEHWVIPTERGGRREEGRGRGGPMGTQLSLLTRWGAGNSYLMKSSNYSQKKRSAISWDEGSNMRRF